MGLGGGRSEWDDYEWVRLPDLPSGHGRRAVATPAPGRAVVVPSERPPRRGRVPAATQGPLHEWLDTATLWTDDAGPRVLLVDLDNLRADPARWRRRMGAVVRLAHQADHVVLAGQVGAVTRARPHLAELADGAHAVADGSDLADHVLLDAVQALDTPTMQVVLMSNDFIFAALADRGPLVVLSPGASALSDRLRDAATQVVDLAAIEMGG